MWKLRSLLEFQELFVPELTGSPGSPAGTPGSDVNSLNCEQTEVHQDLYTPGTPVHLTLECLYLYMVLGEQTLISKNLFA
jgi:hypothetical protein